MASKPMSSSCQSIATAASSAATTAAAVSISASNATSVGSLIAAACQQQQQHHHHDNQPQSQSQQHHQQSHQPSSHYVNGTGSLGRLKFHKSLDASDEEIEYAQLSQSTHILGRYKSERFLASKPDEDRRRRTIIVEKKNDTYGFTLQSYGIHYKRDEELEMITYVDYVEYGGPAYRSGMREGDVILSINGRDMEKADHKTIVEFIKQCDTRMRMVVLFEDCVRKVDLHMRYIQLQSMLQHKMNELERVHLRERELLEGKWKTHSLPARKKANANTSPSDGEGVSPTEAAVETGFYRPALSTEDVGNIAARQQAAGGGAIIPPPAQFMLTYHYLDPTYRYVLRPTHGSSEDYIDGLGLQRSSSDHQPTAQRFMLHRTESVDTNTISQPTTTAPTQYHSTTSGGATVKPPAPPPRTCEKHKPPAKPPKAEKEKPASGKHYHSSAGRDNVSLDAYDLASPAAIRSVCQPTPPSPAQGAHSQAQHRERERERVESKEQRIRPKSQSHASPERQSGGHHHHHHHHHHSREQQQQQQIQKQQQQQQQQPVPHHHHYHHPPQGQTTPTPCHANSQSGSTRSRYFDLASGLASHCSLHSCTSSEFAPADSASYTTSISTDTLFWDPKSETGQSRQHSTKSRQSYEQPHHQQQQQQQPQQHPHQQTHQMPHHHHHHPGYHQRYHVTATQVQPSQIYPNTISYVQKPKSWDNLATKAAGGYGFGYGYLDTVAVKPPVKLQIAQQRHSMPRRNPYGRFSTYGDVENYAPPPTEFVGELTTTTTTTITAKSTEELMAACDCLSPQQQAALKAAQYQLSQNQKLTHQNSCQMGYYSHLPRPTTDVGTSTSQQVHNGAGDVSTVSEATRL
ncbi:GL15547 [Drosophila persimilis]|uniref:GL15547 n=1 Tax=Drosophila persimilis TaxID=7234 RepID=B4H6F5_DROPE|nr:GL15547 [Drosophila persimilis]